MVSAMPHRSCDLNVGRTGLPERTGPTRPPVKTPGRAAELIGSLVCPSVNMSRRLLPGALYLTKTNFARCRLPPSWPLIKKPSGKPRRALERPGLLVIRRSTSNVTPYYLLAAVDHRIDDLGLAGHPRPGDFHLVICRRTFWMG